AAARTEHSPHRANLRAAQVKHRIPEMRIRVVAGGHGRTVARGKCRMQALERGQVRAVSHARTAQRLGVTGGWSPAAVDGRRSGDGLPVAGDSARVLLSSTALLTYHGVPSLRRNSRRITSRLNG